MDAAGGGPELLEAGPQPPSPAARRRRLLLVVAAVLLLTVLGVGTLLQRERVAAELPVPSPAARSSRPLPTPLPVSSTRRPQPDDPVVLRRSGPGVPGAGSGELFLRSVDTVYRIDLASGRVTSTRAGLGTSGPVSFLALPAAVVLRPLDLLPGLRVPDDRPALELQGRLRRASSVLPATQGRLWITARADRDRSTAVLVTADGTPVRSLGENGSFVADGSGGLLLVDTGGVWERRQARWHRITTGSVLAVGPHHYLLSTCGIGHDCTTVRYDRRTHRSTHVPAERLQLFGGGGLLSPDGRYAASMTYSEDGSSIAELVDLTSGHVVTELEEPNASADITSLAVWSADGRRLVVLNAGRLVVVDPATGQRTEPDLGLSDLLGLTLRTP
ncbi:hypothetical protein [uncultured Friedmanniella sp.]|uniref:hypothetical protein n=1 Tax=uncultured Friedmanniella sp. TaxID=335381 RepID=UPI0035CC22BF